MTEEPTRRSPLLPYINEMSLVAHISFGDLMINPIQQSRQSTNFPTADTVVGSGLAALGTFLRQAEPRLIRYRTLVFLLIAAGVGAMWGLTAKGGFGGKSGLPIWWGLLILPYLLGYPMAIGGPGNPRWFLCLGIAVGLWYLVLGGIIFSHPSKESSAVVLILLAAIGLATIASCTTRLVSATRRSKAIGPFPP